MEQARRDADRGQKSEDGSQKSAGKVPFVAHKRSFRAWLVTMTAETFFKLLRGDFPESTSPRPSPQSGEGDGAHGVRRPTSELNGGRSATRPTSTDFPAAACAAAISENNKPQKEKTNEDPS
jgi:hypothetical protein